MLCHAPPPDLTARGDGHGRSSAHVSRRCCRGVLLGVVWRTLDRPPMSGPAPTTHISCRAATTCARTIRRGRPISASPTCSGRSFAWDSTGAAGGRSRRRSYSSGRVARLRLSGMRPDVIAGDQFRQAVGAVNLKSTAFTVEKRGGELRFTGRGFGHGVGMCVIGAGRRATRGETARAILAQYDPGLELTPLSGMTMPVDPPTPSPSPQSATATSSRRSATGAVEVVAPRASGISVVVPQSSAIAASEIERIAASAHEELAISLGTSVLPMTIRLHDTLDSFRLATNRPWWVSDRGRHVDRPRADHRARAARWNRGIGADGCCRAPRGRSACWPRRLGTDWCGALLLRWLCGGARRIITDALPIGCRVAARGISAGATRRRDARRRMLHARAGDC